MLLSCPHCGFTKEIDPDRIPATVKKVGCPSCKESFPLPERQQPPAEPVAQPEPLVATPPPTPLTTETPALPSPPLVATIPAGELPKAGFWIRLVASLLDSALAGGAQLIFSFILGMTAGNLMGDGDSQGGAALSLLTTLFGIVFGVAYSVFFTGYGGQTPGKMLVRIKVIRTSGAEIGYGRAFLREVPGKFLSGVLLGIGYLMVAFDAQKQGLHDRIADTYVIKL